MSNFESPYRNDSLSLGQVRTNPYEAPAGSGFVSDAPAPNWSSTLFSFQGRVPRRVYWGVTLVAIGLLYAIIFALIATFGEDSPAAAIGILISYVPFVWVSLAVAIKRWHDRDKSGWWILIGFIPIVGAIWQLVECGCLRGTVGSNTYGADPT